MNETKLEMKVKYPSFIGSTAIMIHDQRTIIFNKQR